MTTAITTGTKGGPSWSATRVVAAAKKGEFADLRGGAFSLTGANKHWTDEYRKSGGNLNVGIFTHYFVFPTPYNPADPSVIAGIRTCGKVGDFMAVFSQIYNEYGQYIAQNMAANGIGNSGLNDPKMTQIIQVLVSLGYDVGNIPADETLRAQHNQMAWLIFTAFTPLTVNVQLKPAATAAVQTPVSFFRGGQGGVLDLSPAFVALSKYEADVRAALAKSKPAASATEMGDPFAQLAVFASIRNITPVIGQTAAGGIDLTAKVPPKGGADKLSDLKNLYDAIVREKKFMLVAGIASGKQVGFEITPQGRYIHKSKVDLPGPKVIGDYVYFGDSEGQWRHVLARKSNPDWSKHMAAAVRALSGDNSITAEMVEKQYARRASELATPGAQSQSYIPGSSTRPAGTIGRVPSPRGTTMVGTIPLGTVPMVAQPGTLIGSPRSAGTTGLLGTSALPVLG